MIFLVIIWFEKSDVEMNNLAMSRVLTLASRSKLMSRSTASALHTSICVQSKDTTTHTGQTWSSEDPRSLRFMHNPKQTNTQWAIDLISKVPPKQVTHRVVACEGDPNPALGHPKVYINLESHEPVACIYCGLRYQLKEGHHHH